MHPTCSPPDWRAGVTRTGPARSRAAGASDPSSWPRPTGRASVPVHCRRFGTPVFPGAGAGEFHLQLATQTGDDPGQVMQAALADGIARCEAAAVLGWRVPASAGLVLEEAFRAPGQGSQLLGPNDNGGYYLIGLQAPCPGLFQGIAWGGSAVLTDTLARRPGRGPGIRAPAHRARHRELARPVSGVAPARDPAQPYPLAGGDRLSAAGAGRSGDRGSGCRRR